MTLDKMLSMYLHFRQLREIPRGYLMFFFNLCIDFTQVSDELLFLILFPKHVWHFFLQSTDDVGMDLDREEKKKIL